MVRPRYWRLSSRTAVAVTSRSCRLATSRDAFFGPADHVPAEHAAGRIAAETLSPCPPGVPVVLPGEILTQPVIDYLRSGVAATMLIPDATDPELNMFRVVAR